MPARLRYTLARLYCRVRAGGCEPDWAYTIAARLPHPVCIRCGRPIPARATAEEIGATCVEDPEHAW